MSQCTSRTSWSARARTRGSQVAVSWRTQSGSSSGGISPARATASAQRWKPSRRSASPPLSASGAGGSGTRSASTWPNRSVSRSRVSIVASSSRSGCVPSTSSSRIATQSPSSYDARRSAQSSCEPMRVSAVTSRRNSSGVFGLSSVPTAFTNARVPSSHTSRVAQPGDMPPTWSAAATTGEPSSSATQSRTCSGMAVHGARTPTARGLTSRAARRATARAPRPATAGGRGCRERSAAPGRRPT